MDQENNRNIENTQAQMRKGILEFCILLVIAKGKKLYASDILEQLKKTELIVVEGTLYPLLNRLKREGLLDYSWVESKSGPPRKYYIVTQNGTETIKELTKTWKALAKSINSLMKNHE
jgi:PadR family transcriptional regulator PadR